MSKRQLFAGLLFGVLLVSCGLNNTMFNARKYFRAAQARPLNSNGKPTPQAVDEYTKTIQKCGVVLTEYKGSKIVDDALFLLARSLYYKGNSAFQAKDQFEALINGFPDSPHVPEAHIYLARVLRQINRPQESENLLESFVRDSRHVKYHPRALMVLAEFEIVDKDYLRAQYWLQRIIADYPNTPEFKEAFFLFGKNYYEQRDYAASLREFEKLVDTRGINKELKLEGRYYMALNLLELGEIERSTKIVASLINDESRPEKLSLVRVLNARLLLAGKDPQKGITEVDDISKAYPRSISSAAAYYYLGNHYFYSVKDINQATTAYNKVRTEFPSSELVSPAQQKTTAITQLKQSQNLSLTGNLQQFVDYHMLAAENYLIAFALPDSALLMYDRILQAQAPLITQLDSLYLEITANQTRTDSLAVRISELEEILSTSPALSDSLDIQLDGEETETDTLAAVVIEPFASESNPDTLQVQPIISEEPVAAEPDTLEIQPVISEEAETAEPDTLQIQPIITEEPLAAEPDSLQIQPLITEDPVAAEPDSLSSQVPEPEVVEVLPPDDSFSTPDSLETSIPEPLEGEGDATGSEILPEPIQTDEAKEPAITDPRATELAELNTLNASLQTELTTLDTKAKNLSGILTRLDKEILPLVYFAKASLLSKQNAPADSLQQIYTLMLSSFPTDKYTNALRMLTAGEPVRLIDPEEDRQNAVLDEALGLYQDQPDSMRVLLEELSESQYSNIRLRANFRLAWMHSFELADTLSAKPYLDEVLQHPEGGDYANLTRKFYDGKNFIFPKPAPDTLATADSLKAEQAGDENKKPETDDPEELELLDPNLDTDADSLDIVPNIIQPEIPAEPDSLDAPDPIEPLDIPTAPDDSDETSDPPSESETTPIEPLPPDSLLEPDEPAPNVDYDADTQLPPPVLPPSGDPELE